MKRFLQIILSSFLVVFSLQVGAQTQIVPIAPDIETLTRPFSPDDEDSFREPDKVFSPEIWFYFIGGNISKEGIDADLKAISYAGFSGIQWFHGDGGVWPATERQIRALSPEWEDIVGYLGQKADSLGLRFALQTCPGWSMAGGPWIKPEKAMRQLVWSRTDVDCGHKPNISIPRGEPSVEEWRDYRDICVLAFPTPLGDTGERLKPTVLEACDDQWKAMIEGSNGGVILNAGFTNVVRFSLKEGEVIRTIHLPPINSISDAWCYDPGIRIKLTATVADKEHILADADLPMSNWQDGVPIDFELACNEIENADYYTFTVINAHPGILSFVEFMSAAHKNCWQGEAGWTLLAKEPCQEHTCQNPLAFINSGEILDVTDKMDANGKLDWTAPEGNYPEGKWTILRFGHVNSGRKNGPTTPEATGWECNKFDAEAAEIQFINYVGRLQEGPLNGKAKGMLMDSWECRTQTWTSNMEEMFQSSVGYSLKDRLPAIIGYVVDSQEETSRLLIDWRRFVDGLYRENFFKKMTDLAHEKGLGVQYETAGADVVTMDPLAYFQYADVPMCEFFQPIAVGYVGDLDFKPIKPTASAAHIYGKPRVAAESFTSFNLSWDEHWQVLKEVANLNMSEGVTHNVFAEYTHNPQIGFLPPGTTFGSAIGTPFLRGQTWWKYMPWFTQYLARTSYMLERGRPVSDVLWYLGDEVGHKPFQHTGNGGRQSGSIRFPDGFKYDYCNPDALLRRLGVENGKICTPEGVSYEVLWIPENERMLPETVRKIEELVRNGAKVIANAPISPATLKDDADKLLESAVSDLWGATVEGVNKVGKGYLVVGMKLADALKALGLKPHFWDNGASVLWSERTIDGARWYYLAAPVGGGFHGPVRLEGKGRAEWWNPVDGTIKSLRTKGWGRMKTITLDLERAESGFVVFRGRSSRPVASRTRAFEEKRRLTSIKLEDWRVSFPEGWGIIGGPITLDDLRPWKDLDLGDEGKAFSGTATYETRFEVNKDLIGKEMVLNLGNVEMIADVIVNGKSAGVRWTPPYRMDISYLITEGKNTLTVYVTSTWYNRLAYDASQPEPLRKTWTIAGPEAGSPLHDSGLLGPVSIDVFN